MASTSDVTSGKSGGVVMSTLEEALDRIEFGPGGFVDVEMSSASRPMPPPSPPLTPIMLRGFNAAMQPFHPPSTSSTPASSTAGSSKSQHLTMSLALEELGRKVADSITNATSVLQDTIARHFTDPVPVRKQRAILQVQEEKNLDDNEVVTMMELFQSDVAIADTYNSIKRDGIREIFLARCLQDVREVRAREKE